MIIGHSDDTTDLAYLEKLMAAGSFIGTDRFGVDVFLTFEDRVATVVELCARGHDDQMVLSHDAACLNDWLDEDVVAMVMPRWSFLHISNDVIPALREKGVTAEQIDQMLVQNPQKLFERQGSY